MFSQDPLVPQMCLIIFLFLEVTPVVVFGMHPSCSLGVSWQTKAVTCEDGKRWDRAAFVTWGQIQNATCHPDI